MWFAKRMALLFRVERTVKAAERIIKSLCLARYPAADFKTYFGFIVVQFFELGHTMKS